jgi:ribosomal protein S12 methylthiotransferase
LSRNQAQVGRILPVLVEGHGDNLSIGRSYRDAPEIDGLVLIPGELPIGELVPVRIDGAMTYDLTGHPIFDGGEDISSVFSRSEISVGVEDRAGGAALPLDAISIRK